MTSSRAILPLLVLAALVLSVLACGSDNSGTTIGTNAPGQAPTQPPPTIAVHAVGEVIQVQDHTITLNTATVSSGILKANFTIVNAGNSEMTVSSMLSFSAKDNDGTKLDSSPFDCGSSLDGKVLAGDKLRGDVCWKTTSASPFKIYYEASLFGSGAVVWQVK